MEEPLLRGHPNISSVLLQDYGVTVESVADSILVTRWNGNLMRTRDAADNTKRNIKISAISASYWMLMEPLVAECPNSPDDEMVMFLGGIPPGHFGLRKRMQE